MIKTNKFIYWALISTFVTLWLVVAFVSTLHAITFFNITNSLALAILLGAAYEIGQASVLFSILMSKNKDKLLPWSLMILLTALQVTANVYASFKYMVGSETTDWVYWQKAILFGVEASSPEMYQIIISWISGALLPIVALGMTALVAENIKIVQEEKAEEAEEPEEPKEVKEPKEEFELPLSGTITMHTQNVSVGRMTPEEEYPRLKPGVFQVIKPQIEVDLQPTPKLTVTPHMSKKEEEEYNDYDGLEEETLMQTQDAMRERSEVNEKSVFDGENESAPSEGDIDIDEIVESLHPSKIEKKPKKLTRGWHLRKKYVDSNGDVYSLGRLIKEAPQPTPSVEEPKKA